MFNGKYASYPIRTAYLTTKGHSIFDFKKYGKEIRIGNPAGAVHETAIRSIG